MPKLTQCAVRLCGRARSVRPHGFHAILRTIEDLVVYRRVRPLEDARIVNLGADDACIAAQKSKSFAKLRTLAIRIIALPPKTSGKFGILKRRSQRRVSPLSA